MYRTILITGAGSGLGEGTAIGLAKLGHTVLGVLSPPMVGAYSATKHAVQAIAEAMQDELRPFGIQVQTINPGPYLTGFNETMVEAAYQWLDDAVTFTPRAMVKEVTDGLLAKPEGRLNPNDMIAKMIELIPDQNGPFRNIFPDASQEWFRQYEKAMLERTI
jgi:NAD(P)-dependent dehydrogenase (short-subunit alcohol dehydrogenase family)